MAGLADLFGESYDPKNDKPRLQHVPVRPKGELKKLDAGYYRDMPVMDKVSNVARTLGRAVGYSPTLANRMGEEAKTGIGFVPGAGDALGAVEAKESLLAGDIGKGLLQAGLTAVGVVPGVGDAVAKAGREGLETVADTMAAATRPSIKAYHGSPHSFDRFSMDKIGTGEGAQAYGHGLYFAENEKVAQDYRDTLSKTHDLHWDGRPLATRQDYFGVLDPLEETDWRQAKVLDYFAKQRGTTEDRIRGLREYYYGQPDMEAAIDQLEPRMMAKPSGSMYEVNIAADPEQFLDWDKPLSEQSERVRTALEGLGSAQKNRPLAPTDTGKDVYYKQTQGLTSEGATERVKQAGLPGIKYLDAGSRGNVDTNEIRGTISMLETAVRKNPQDEYLVGQLASAKQKLQQAESGGSRNYVVFDDKLISIVKKYGIPAALGAGLITEEMARQMQEQGLGET